MHPILNCITIKLFESYGIMKWKTMNPNIFIEIWHDCLSHLGSTIMGIVHSNEKSYLLGRHNTTKFVALNEAQIIKRLKPYIYIYI